MNDEEQKTDENAWPGGDQVVWLAWEYCHRLKGTVGVTEGEDNAICNQEGNDYA